MKQNRKPTSLEYFNFHEGIIRNIEEQYGINKIDTLLPVLIDGEYCSLLEITSETSRKIILETENRELFLKQVPWYCDKIQQINFCYNFLVTLRRNDILVPHVFQTTNGNPYIEIEEYKYMLYKFYRGFRYKKSENQIKSASRNLAKIHAVKYVSKLECENLFNNVLRFVELLNDCLVIKPNVEKADYKRSYHKFQSLVIEKFRCIVKKAQKECAEEGWNELESIGVHGDYSPSNLLFDEQGKVSIIFDFDNCTMCKRVHDLAEALITFCSLKYKKKGSSFASYIPLNIINKNFLTFLMEYNSINKLNKIEWRCLPWIIRVVLIELFCLGLVRTDFGLDQYPAILACINSDINLDSNVF